MYIYTCTSILCNNKIPYTLTNNASLISAYLVNNPAPPSVLNRSSARRELAANPTIEHSPQFEHYHRSNRCKSSCLPSNRRSINSRLVQSKGSAIFAKLWGSQGSFLVAEMILSIRSILLPSARSKQT